MKGHLLDTNIISELRKGKRANPGVLAWFQTTKDAELFLSVLVIGEIRSGIERVRSKDPDQARSLQRWLEGLIKGYVDRVLPVTLTIADRWGKLSAVNPPSVVDGLLAATVIEHDLCLVTRNVDDVRRTGAHVLNPFETVKKSTGQ